MIPEVILGQQAQILSAAVLITLPLAWKLGRGPERVLAFALTTIFALNFVRQVYLSGANDTAPFLPDHALLDGILLVCVGGVAMRANRLYPLIMAGAALVAVLAHLLRWFDLFEGRFSYLVLITVPAYVVVAAFWTGLALHVRRERRFGPYPDWRDTRTVQSFAASAKLG